MRKGAAARRPLKFQPLALPLPHPRPSSAHSPPLPSSSHFLVLLAGKACGKGRPFTMHNARGIVPAMSRAELRFAIRPDERRDTWAALLMLFGVVGSIAILETARDALFLARLPATRLPFMYLTIAAVSLAIVSVMARWGQRVGRYALGAWTFVAASVTFGL